MIHAPATAMLATYLLRLADDNLILAQRLGEWISRAPELEEDIALANIGLDHLGVARALYRYASDLDEAGRSDDDLAFLRTEREFTNLVLCEQQNGDFARTMVRQLIIDGYQRLVWDRLAENQDTRLAGIAAKARKEAEYHFRHSSQWVIRLGDGTIESHLRTQTAVDQLWKYVPELFGLDDIDEGFIGSPERLQNQWQAAVRPVLTEATLGAPEITPSRLDGRHGTHTEHLGHLLAEMQWMQRTYPGMTW